MLKDVEVNLKRMMALMIFLTLSTASQIRLVRDQTAYVPLTYPVPSELTLKLVSDEGTRSIPVLRFQNLRLFREFISPLPREGRHDRQR
jgi:hypothetical protein